jgi:hypothetical protein
MSLEGPAMHLCLVLLVCRSYEKKPDFAGLPGVTLHHSELNGKSDCLYKYRMHLMHREYEI